MFPWLTNLFKPKNPEALRGFEAALKQAEDYHIVPTYVVRKWKRSLDGNTYAEGNLHLQLCFGSGFAQSKGNTGKRSALRTNDNYC